MYDQGAIKSSYKEYFNLNVYVIAKHMLTHDNIIVMTSILI